MYLGWKYRKQFVVNNSGSDLTDYQLKFTVNRSSGSDSGFTVYVGSNCESDYKDIRFTTVNGAVCPYWIESSDSSTATIWVKVPSIPAGNTTLYLYYGNPNATSVSNGDSVFDFFEDWNSGILDTNKFVANGDYSISGGVISQTDNNNNMIFSKNTFDVTSYIIRARSKVSSISVDYGFMGGFSTNQNHSAGGYQAAFTFKSNDAVLENIKQGTHETQVPVSNNDPANNTDWYVTEIRKSGSTNYLTVTDSNGTTGTASSSADSTTTANNYIEVMAARIGLTVYNDWVAVRKYTTTEPTVSSWGSEEPVRQHDKLYSSGMIIV